MFETRLAGVSQHPWDLDEECGLIRYYSFDYNTGECDGGDCADAAWETQYIEVPTFDNDETYTDIGEDAKFARIEWACEKLHGPNTLESDICLIRA